MSHTIRRLGAPRAVRFGIVGALTYGLELLLLILFGALGLDLIVAYVTALALAVQFNFAMNQGLVWHDRKPSRTLRGLTRRWASFHAAIALSLVINVAAFVVAQPHMPLLPATLVALAASLVIKFLSLDRLVFRG